MVNHPSDQFDQKEVGSQLMVRALDQSSEAVIITDAELEKPGPRMTYVNRAACEMTGYPKSELIGRTPRIFQGEKTDRKLLDDLKASCAAGEIYSAETINYRKNGDEYVVRWKISPIRDESGTITHFISTQRDVTEEVRQQEQLQQHQDFLTEIEDLAQVGGWRYDRRTDSVFWTDQVYRIHGLSPSETIDLERALSFYTPESRDVISKAFTACLEKGESYEFILNMENAHGDALQTRSKGEPLMEAGEIVGAWGVFQDITEMHKIQFENKVFYDLAVELTCIASMDGFLLELNERWEEVLGYAREELKNAPIYEFIHPDDRVRTAEAYEEMLHRKEIKNFENRYLHKNGDVIHFLWNAVVAPDGKTVYALARDISDRRKKELELQEALGKAKLANESKNQFLMVMSHEMRTPLNPIIGFADLLERQIENSDHLEYVQQIKHSAHHLLDLISDILDISSIEAGRSVMENKPLQVAQTISRAVELVRHRAVAKGLELNFEDNNWLQRDPPLVCMGDKRKIRQVLINLINNAIKFTRDGEVTVDFLPPAFEEGKAGFCIRISDTGIGMKSDQLELIFERFYQISMTSSREFGGQGLGLTLSRQLARQMEGDISVSSIYGKGSVFVFSFRLEVVEGGLQAPDSPTPDQTHADSLEGMQVLVVEDDPVNRMVIGKMLSRLKVPFETANDGLQALDRTKEKAFSLILMDIQMPNMDGIEATRQIRAGDGKNSKIPIVAVSAHAIDGVKKAGVEAGMNQFIEKPISIGKLSEAMAAMRKSPS